ncbi:MAG TPA: FAD-dependent oxidoreductase [Planctomycetota bacterium]|nr:FAD-dependent oxidoreductase [Planctomycetota bacterium]
MNLRDTTDDSFPRGEHQATDLDLPSEREALWSRTRVGRDFPALERDLEVDVAIVGGGISGLTAGILLKRAGKRVALVEAARIERGISRTMSAGLAQCTDTRIPALIRDFGHERARLVWDSSRAALEQIRKLVALYRIESPLHSLPGWLFTQSAVGAEELHQEYLAIREIGVPVHWVERGVPLPFPVAAALRYDHQVQVRAHDYLLHLADALDDGGSHVFEGSSVVELGAGSELHLSTEGGSLRARDVIVTSDSHAPAPSESSSCRRHAIAARVRENLPEGVFWDDAEPFHCLHGHSVDGQSLLIASGEDHLGSESDPAARFQRLADWLRERFEVLAIGQRWSRKVVDPVEALPCISHDARSERIHEVTRCKGASMSLQTLAAMIVSDRVLGRSNPWESCYGAAAIEAPV